MLLDGKALAATMRADLAREGRDFQSAHGRAPGLAVVLVGDDPASQVYVGSKVSRRRKSACVRWSNRLPADADEATVLGLVAALNADDGGRRPGSIAAAAAGGRPQGAGADPPDKDVDGFHPVNAGRLARRARSPLHAARLRRAGQTRQSPTSPACTPWWSALQHRRQAGGALLLMENCTVTIAHSRTPRPSGPLPQRRPAGRGHRQPHFVTAGFVKPGAIVIERRHQPRRGRGRQGSAGGRRRLRRRRAAGLGDHARSRRRRADDHRLSALQHAARRNPEAKRRAMTRQGWRLTPARIAWGKIAVHGSDSCARVT